jgi:DNA-directed RNA polymerase specialized sigma24 family protein
MVAPDSGYSKPRFNAKERANYAGVNVPVMRRGQSPSIVDESFEGNPERVSDTASHMALIRACRRKHPKECEYLKFVLLHYVDGWSITDVAKAMGVSFDTAKGRITRTLCFLETFIREQEHQA